MQAKQKTAKDLVGRELEGTWREGRVDRDETDETTND